MKCERRDEMVSMSPINDLNVDVARLQSWIDTLARFSDAAAPAVTRVLFSEVDLQARAWVKARCAEEGLVLREDAVGNRPEKPAAFDRVPARDVIPRPADDARRGAPLSHGLAGGAPAPVSNPVP